MIRISIVLPSLNSKRYLRACINAFLDQDYDNKRLIIVDGKSEDGSHEIIRSLQEKYEEIHWIQEVDQGLSDAINIGLKHVNDGEIFGFLGSDDILLQGTFKKLEDALRNKPDAVGAFFDSFSQSATGERKRRNCPSDNMSLSNLLKHRTIAGLQNTYLKSEIVKRYEFNTEIKYAMDYELYLRLAADGLGEKVFHIPTPSTININDDNISTRFRKSSKREALQLAYKYAPIGWRKLLVGLRLLR